MSRTQKLYLVMFGLALCWGLTIPMNRVAVSTGHHPVGLIAWQSIYMTIFLSAYLIIRRIRFPLERAVWGLYLVVALSGTLIPNTFTYTAAAELPAGVMAIVVALVPMFALPMALALGLEQWRWLRLSGVLLGALAVILLVGPETSLPTEGAAFFVLIALVAPFFYGVEGNYLAWRGTSGLDPVQVLWGAYLIAMLVAVPVAVSTGHWIDPTQGMGQAEFAIIVGSISHSIAYTGYIWLVGAGGSVFAAQIAYLVTGCGVLWSMALLGERYSIWVWLAFVLMLVGVALVQPREKQQEAKA